MRNQLCQALAVLLFLTGTAFAACTATDPCAPKKVLGDWDKSLAFGFNYTSGNSDTTVLSVLGKFARETDQDFIDLNFLYGYGEDRSKGELEDSTNKNDFRAGASYRYLLDERLYAVAASTFLYDEIADVDYRVLVSPGLGYFLLKNEDWKLGLEAGPGYVFERVGEVDNDYFAPRIADRADWVITCTSKLFQTAEILFDTTESDNYLINAELGIEAALASNLSLVLLVRDTYDNLPAANREKNDIAMITALKVAF